MATTNPNVPAGAIQFTVLPGRHKIVNVAGLTPEDRLRLYRRMCEEKTCPGDGTDRWAPLVICGKEYVLKSNNNLLCIDIPGDYYLAFDGAAPITDVSVCIDKTDYEGRCNCGC